MAGAARGDTIAAIATAAGRAGVGILRISGPGARAAAEALGGPLPPPRTASLRNLYRPADAGESGRLPLDQGLVLYFPAPHSYTGEDVVELQMHGSPVVLAELLEVLCTVGARIARPGEFSERAFLNGRVDLAQAEAVADLIDAGSRAAARAASRAMQGEFSRRVEDLVEALIQLRVLLEASLDFSDDDVPAAAPAALRPRIDALVAGLAQLQRAAAQGRRLREGLRVAIAGAPNVGKSTLLNRLAGAEAAIVSPLAGTTRDVLREHIVLDDLPLTVIDTAGLRETDDPVEREGVRRARAEIALAELVLQVADDRDAGEAEAVATFPELAAEIPVLRIRNKCDLSGIAPGIGLDAQGRETIRISAATGAGCDALTAAIRRIAGLEDGDAHIYSARARHLEALAQAAVRLQAARAHAHDHADPALIAEELRLAQQALEAITGRFGSEDLLGRIFSSFCLGK